MKPRASEFKTINDSKFEEIKLQLKRDQLIVCRVVSGSMEPVLKIGEMIEVAPTDEKPRPFDILIFHQNEQLICHMFLKQSVLNVHGHAEAEYLTGAYDGPLFDYPVAKSKILGRVVSHKLSFFRKLMYLLKRMRSEA